MEFAGRLALVTGGGSGIGRALALGLAARGARLLLAGRRAAPLATVAAEARAAGAPEALAIAADVTEDAGRAAILAAARQAGGLAMLVNNAGAVRGGRLEAAEETAIRRMVEANLLGPMLLTRAALPLLRAAPAGAVVVNVSSALGLVGAPFYAAYAATKAGIAMFGEALRRELLGEGIHVLNAFPGATDTPMMATNRATAEQGFARETPEAVAEAILSGLAAGALAVVRGGETRQQMIALNRSDPAALDARFAAMKPVLERAVGDHAAL